MFFVLMSVWMLSGTSCKKKWNAIAKEQRMRKNSPFLQKEAMQQSHTTRKKIRMELFYGLPAGYRRLNYFPFFCSVFLSSHFSFFSIFYFLNGPIKSEFKHKHHFWMSFLLLMHFFKMNKNSAKRIYFLYYMPETGIYYFI